MPISSTSVTIGEVEYEPYDGPENIHVDGQPLRNTLEFYLQKSGIFVGDPFDKNSKEIKFVLQIERICHKIFDTIREIKDGGGEGMAAQMAARLYECFTDYWINLLWQGRDVLGIQFWKKILEITFNWEAKNPNVTIHKGTPYFFLAENYLLVGDRDMAFLYLFNALIDDIKLGNWVPSMNYPQEAPAYLTIAMKSDMQNQMYYFVDELRRQLDQYIQSFNLEYSKSFSIAEFDKKFLSNLYMKDVISFFVFNFVYLVESRKFHSSIQHTNEFDILRSIDFIFNLCLIIDETLKQAELKNQGQVNSKHFISDGIKWLSGFRK